MRSDGGDSFILQTHFCCFILIQCKIMRYFIAPYTVITFPFLFGVMFGDMGHGLIMLLAAAVFIWKEKELEARRIKDEVCLCNS
jgi:hypothetical protein